MRAAFDANARNKVVFGLGPDDARDLARMAPGLVAEDFMALKPYDCLLYTSDAADERSRVDFGGRRILKKNKSLPTTLIMI